MRALLFLSMCLFLLATAIATYAEPLPASLPSEAPQQSFDDAASGSKVFLNTTLVLDRSGVPSGWMLAPVSSGVSSCDSEESVNCLTSADLVSRLNPVPAASPDDGVRSNGPEPATWVMLAGGAPLLWGLVRNAV